MGGETAALAAKDRGFVRVADYRLYGLDGVDKVASAVWIEAGDDEIAIEVAKEVLNGRNGELWQRGRFIARLDGVAPDA